MKTTRVVLQELEGDRVVKNAMIGFPDFVDLLRWLPKLKALVELLEEFKRRLMDILGEKEDAGNSTD